MISDTNFGKGRVTSQTQGSTLSTAASVAVAVLGVIALFAANLLVWVDSTLLNTTNFVSGVGQALDEPESEQRIADVLAQRIIEAPEVQRELDQIANNLGQRVASSEAVQERLPGELPANFDFLTRAAQPQLERLISDLVLRVLESDFSGQLRDTVLRTLHASVLAVLEDRSATGVGVQGDQIVLDLRDVVQRVFDRLGITPPARAQEPEFGRVVLVDDAGALREASFFVRNRTEIAMGALIVAALLFGAAIFLSRDHRGGVLICGYAIAGAGLLTLLLLWGSNLYLESEASERVVTREIIRTLETNLRLQSVALLLLGACLIAVSDRRILRLLEGGWSRGAAAIERFGVSQAALIAIGAAAVVLLLV